MLMVFLTGCAQTGVKAVSQAAQDTADAPGAAQTAQAAETRPGASSDQTETQPTPVPPTPRATATPVDTPTVTPTPTITPTATKDTRLLPDQWTAWPIVPTLSARALDIYLHGQKLGIDVHSFARIGDCQSEPAVFMGIYDDPTRYWFDEKHKYLQAAVDQFKGSFNRDDFTAQRGFGIADIFSALKADPNQCNGGETPIACEFRLYKPVIVLINMGTNWCAGCTNKFDKYLRMTVDYAIENGVVPVLGTKADNFEGDNSLNLVIARVAYDYDLPLWNFWAAVQYLPNHGLREDDPKYLTVDGWNERSFTGLMVLNALWTEMKKSTP